MGIALRHLRAKSVVPGITQALQSITKGKQNLVKICEDATISVTLQTSANKILCILIDLIYAECYTE
jgi:ribosomal protein L7Ae-like RNA K-turn-binding protein